MRRNWLVTQISVVAVSLLIPQGGHAAPRSAPRSIDLRDRQEQKIAGSSDRRFAGEVVGGGGDVNGDGIGDVLVSECGDSLRSSPMEPGSLFVIFGDPLAPGADLAALGDQGFEIRGADIGDGACHGDILGDVNGDGLDDILVGAPGADNMGRDSGSAYVVYGRTSTHPVALALFDRGLQEDAGYRVDGQGSIDLFGESVGAAGDVNGDGIPDSLISASFGGYVKVVFNEPVHGSRAPFGDNGADLGGYRITRPADYRVSEHVVANAGDVNGDGVPDALIGVPKGKESPGFASVIFGSSEEEEVDVSHPGDRGFRIQGRTNGESFGYAVTGAGDLNSDGLADLAIGAPRDLLHGYGSVYLIFGKESSRRVRTARLGSQGYRIRSQAGDDDFGYDLAAAGDIDGDGVPDLFVGARRASNRSRPDSGSLYVLKGLASSGGSALKADPVTMVRFDGAVELKDPCESGVNCAGSRVGTSVASVGDIDGDGLVDVVVGAPGEGERYPGAAYVLLSRSGDW